VCKSGSRVREGLCWCADGGGARAAAAAGVLLSISVALGCSTACMAGFLARVFVPEEGSAGSFVGVGSAGMCSLPLVKLPLLVLGIFQYREESNSE